ncbi:MAG: hypothetical protein OEX18_13785 [Candidatus Krumholzibacteria bacterium]|nr:hypothetical protein [Candidatus Krumholzibacteria bacterium]MDH4338338.1 hypothetical protein [Candidatus Krumholzibacteria bacterium]MDH5270754.1 hypothetical protein [Candidatus Krumholzibacteria bacterium]MDH5626733.1 hypothetical protein [Candidatus Krumholzibacteria bacterium]
MWKRSSVLCAFVVLAALTSSCIFDPKKDDGPPPPPTGDYKDLTNRSDVLFNLQKSYNDRNMTEYERILDDNFTFFLSDGDVNGGLPVQWGRRDELDANTNLFSRTVPPGATWPLCTSIQMDVQFEAGLQWVEVIPDAAPDETWYTTTCFYDFQIEVEPDTKYIPYPGAKAQFTVRNAGTDSNPRWQLVEWRDLGGAQ